MQQERKERRVSRESKVYRGTKAFRVWQDRQDLLARRVLQGLLA